MTVRQNMWFDKFVFGGGASLISQSCPAVFIRRMHVVVSPLGAAEMKQMRERHIQARTRPTGRLQM